MDKVDPNEDRAVHIPVDNLHSSEEDNLVAAADTALDLQYLDRHEEEHCHMGSWNILPAAEEVVGRPQRNSFEDSPPAPSLYLKCRLLDC